MFRENEKKKYVVTGYRNTLSAVEVNVLLFTCVPVSF